MCSQYFFALTVFLEQSRCYEYAVIYSQSKDEGRDNDIKNIEFYMEHAHNTNSEPPGQQDGNTCDQHQGKTPKEKEQDQDYYTKGITN